MRSRTALVLGFAGLAAVAGSTGPTAAVAGGQQRVPLGTSALPAPADARLVASYTGEGTQVYECVANADGSGTWRNRPVAVLREMRRGFRPVGVHDSVSRQGEAPVPQWSGNDGSRVIAQLPPLLNVADPAPQQNISALRLAVAQNSGVGALARVTVIQRDLVRGGVGPVGACAPGSATAVVSPYTTRYTFWAPTTGAAGS